MAAEVGALMRLLARRGEDDGGGGGEGARGAELVTRDFLGGCGGGVLPVRDGVEEIELGLGSTSAGEKRLGVTDLNVAPVFSSVVSPAVPQLQSLLPEHPLAASFLGPRTSEAVIPAVPGYQSVCTLDKVRSALERAQREPPLRKLLHQPAAGPASPASSSTTTSSVKRMRVAARDEEGERESKSPSSSSSSSSVVVQGWENPGAAAVMAAAACPSCLLYVLISRSDPRCPRCNASVPLPTPAGKRPHLDLNVATYSAAPETTAAAAVSPLKTVNFF